EESITATGEVEADRGLPPVGGRATGKLNVEVIPHVGDAGGPRFGFELRQGIASGAFGRLHRQYPRSAPPEAGRSLLFLPGYRRSRGKGQGGPTSAPIADWRFGWNAQSAMG